VNWEEEEEEEEWRLDVISFVDSCNSKHSIALHRLDTTERSYSTASVSSLLATAGGEL
jgi:hypothetical protein